jgi:hypothetical protein
MTDPRMALRALAIYAICIPLALLLGYMLANPLEMGTVTLVGGLALLLSTPLLLRFHFELMLLLWNMAAMFNFLPGRPDAWFLGILLSFAISFTHRILDKRIQFLSVPSVSRPLLFLTAVVISTAMLRGGFGLRSLGGDDVGGKRYFLLLVGILGFFAITVREFPRKQALTFLALFLLGRALVAFGDLYRFVPSFLHPVIYALFPPTAMEGMGVMEGLNRYAGVANAAAGLFAFVLARHGIHKALNVDHRWFAVLVLCAVLSMLGGFRNILISLAVIFAIQFWLEGMFRTKWPLFFVVMGVLMATAVFPFVDRLPLSMQRTLAFLPVDIDPVARADAEGSSDWRVQMWRLAAADAPKYLLLGKGYLISKDDFAYMTSTWTQGEVGAENRGSYIAGDYHNGPLSLIMPLGIWGVVGFLWFIYAGGRALYRNYQYGGLHYKTINTFLFATYVAQVLMFFFVFGSVHSQMFQFTGLVGFSVALNGGIAEPERMEAPAPEAKQGESKSPPPRRLSIPV